MQLCVLHMHAAATCTGTYKSVRHDQGPGWSLMDMDHMHVAVANWHVQANDMVNRSI